MDLNVSDHLKIRTCPMNLYGHSEHHYLPYRYSVDSSTEITAEISTAGHGIAFKVYLRGSAESGFIIVSPLLALAFPSDPPPPRDS